MGCNTGLNAHTTQKERKNICKKKKKKLTIFENHTTSQPNKLKKQNQTRNDMSDLVKRK
jgi:thioredoxin-related protein